jgi:hypothetical protein
MADAIPVPPGQTTAPLQSTVVVQRPPTMWQALKEAGWWAAYDWTMLAVLVALWVTTGFWFLFSAAKPEGASRLTVFIAVLLVSISVQLIWLLVAVFRCALFVLRLHADVAMLPNDAARIAVAFLSGKQQ